MEKIISKENKKFKLWKSLLASKGIKKENLCIVSGKKIIQELLQSKILNIDCELLTSQLAPLTQATHFELSKELFSELDEVGTHFNLLVVTIPEVLTADMSKPAEGLEIICPLGDPANVGSLIRSAEAFSVGKIILTEDSAHPFLQKTIKASAGSCLRRQLYKVNSLDFSAKDIYALDLSGENIINFHWQKNTRLLIGEEGLGTKKFQATKKISIPIHTTESLNAVVAASIAMYDYKLKTGN